MLLTTDTTAGAHYLYLDPKTRGQKGIVEETREFTDHVFFDFDAEGKLIGIEILG